MSGRGVTSKTEMAMTSGPSGPCNLTNWEHSFGPWLKVAANNRTRSSMYNAEAKEYCNTWTKHNGNNLRQLLRDKEHYQLLGGKIHYQLLHGNYLHQIFRVKKHYQLFHGNYQLVRGNHLYDATAYVAVPTFASSRILYPPPYVVHYHGFRTDERLLQTISYERPSVDLRRDASQKNFKSAVRGRSMIFRPPMWFTACTVAAFLICLVFIYVWTNPVVILIAVSVELTENRFLIALYLLIFPLRGQRT